MEEQALVFPVQLDKIVFKGSDPVVFARAKVISYVFLVNGSFDSSKTVSGKG